MKEKAQCSIMQQLWGEGVKKAQLRNFSQIFSFTDITFNGVCKQNNTFPRIIVLLGQDRGKAVMGTYVRKVKKKSI